MKKIEQNFYAVAFVILAFAIFNAKEAGAADCSSGLRTCYCFSEYANHTPVTSVSAVDSGCFPFRSGCEEKCKAGGYKSFALIDPAYPLSDGQANGLNTLSGLSAPSLKITKSADGECTPSSSLLPCLCSNDNVNAVEIGCYQYRTECDPKCGEKNYKYAVLFNASYHSPHTMDNPLNLNDSRNALHTLLTQSQSTAQDAGEAGGPQISEYMVPGTTTDTSGIIQCGRPGQKMCELCDLVRGINIIVQYLMKIAIGIALLAMAIGGIMYIVSAGDAGLMDVAKGAIKNAIIGFVLIFSAYLIVNTTIIYLGTKTGLGINAQWGEFDCGSTAAQHVE